MQHPLEWTIKHNPASSITPPVAAWRSTRVATFARVMQQPNNLIRHSSELIAAADRLQEEAFMLIQHASVTGKLLEQYDAVEKNTVAIDMLGHGDG
jgi:hypothetical protein